MGAEAEVRTASGHVFRVERTRGQVWFAKYRLPDGRQVQKKVGPAWTERGRPPVGYFTKRTAEAWLRDRLDEARRGVGEIQTLSGATFADAAAEWLRYIEHDRKRKPSTVGGYASIVRTQLLPAFGAMAIESVTPAAIEKWLAGTGGSQSSRRKSLVLLHGIFQRARKVWGLRINPVGDVEKPPLQGGVNIEVFSPEEVWALTRPSGRRRARQHALSDGGVHRPAHGQAPGAALARRRRRRQRNSRARQLLQRPPDDA
jgi:integrase